MNQNKQYLAESIRTSDNLRTVAHSAMVRNLSHLSLPEIDAAVNLIGRMVPAGNVPGLILNGLARLSGRHAPPEKTKNDVNLLLKGVEQVLDRAVYGAFFAGPAAAIWGYQHLLKLAGKSITDAFPESMCSTLTMRIPIKALMDRSQYRPLLLSCFHQGTALYVECVF